MARRKEKAEVMENCQTTSIGRSNAIRIKEMQDKMREARRSPSITIKNRAASIFRVPTHLQGQSPEHYQPKMVAIGPYHRRNCKLLIEDKDKWCCVDYFVSRHSLDLNEWLCKMKSREQEARCYYSKDVTMDSESFLETLLLDGCFILHVIKFTSHPRDYVGCSLEQIMLDFLLLENQIPFFVLEQLYSCISTDIIDLTYSSFRDNLPMQEYIMKPSIKPNDVRHLLHMFHSSLVPPDGESIDTDSLPIPPHVPSATELHDQVAVKFKKMNPPMTLSIRFRNGVMEIPILQIRDDIITLLRNLIAFEQCCSRITPYLTNYATFMSCLINKESDVMLLERSGILLNGLPTSKDAAIFFSKLSPGGKFHNMPRYLNDNIVDVNRYHNNKCHRRYADLRLHYFSNPWVTLSVVSAAVLLILSFMQTYYAAITYYHR